MLDTEAGLQTCGGMDAIYRRALKRFAELYERSPVRAGDPIDTQQREAHSLKGAAATLGISLNSVSKHIRLLERAGLVRRRIAGRDHFLALEPGPFDQLTRWMQETRQFWSARLDALEAALRADDAIDNARKTSQIAKRRRKR